MRQTTNRQTDHATEKCVRIGEIASAAKTIPPNNVNCNQTAIRRYNARDDHITRCEVITLIEYKLTPTCFVPSTCQTFNLQKV